MNTFIFNYIVLVSVSGVLSTLLAILVFFNKHSFSGRKTFIWINITSAFYIFGYAFCLSSTSLEEIEWMTRIQYVGLPFIGPLYIVLVMQFTGLDRFFTKKLLTGLFIIPVLTVLVVWTNQLHHLFYKSLTVKVVEGYLLTEFSIGFFYIIHGGYTFGSLLAALVLLIWHGRRIHRSYKLHVIAMFTALLIPMTSSFLYLMGTTPHNMDPVPVIMCITSTIYLIAIYKSKMFKVAPIAKDLVFSHMRDPVIVLNAHDQIVDFNLAAEGIFPNLNKTFIGKDIHTSWKEEFNDFPLPEWSEDRTEVIEQEIQWVYKGRAIYGLFRVFPILKKDHLIDGRALVFTDLTKEMILREELKERASKDGLTNVLNRSAFMDKCSQFADEHKSLAIILFDIDHFKKINDTYGHLVGDQALIHIVGVCKSYMKEEYIFARYGGEEFVIAMPESSIEEASEYAKVLCEEIATSRMKLGEQPLHITASFGVAVHQNVKLGDLLNEADQALYQAKRNGRNNVQVFGV
ncbi:histidine kinase N-terminal 7TM domain-containing protein [Bacillus sp. 31A1R]|uniref:Histidine kinase N-terminal 7TM domain-containing protein n=1 Tax=Robertmurraya mangrovi TaxID=3098077 RepID=A0ABU5J2L4_9BACI|nr:histidine kinase N-terminal 7TM domain-containing protein [Bacillus sp. 31A1R]MDZ5473644.1 histidine kinase N-terminal 7TM domain-containing protein [Bacillus sp. 31A1R]